MLKNLFNYLNKENILKFEKKKNLSSALDVICRLHDITCKMESDENGRFETPQVTFELNLPEEMNSGEVLSLLEVLQSDVQGFDEMLLNAVIDIQEDQTLEAVTKTELQPSSNTLVSHRNTNLQPLPDSISEVTTAQRFKTLQEQDLLEIETNQYSNSTKKNTEWGIGVFNGEKYCKLK